MFNSNYRDTYGGGGFRDGMEVLTCEIDKPCVGKSVIFFYGNKCTYTHTHLLYMIT